MVAKERVILPSYRSSWQSTHHYTLECGCQINPAKGWMCSQCPSHVTGDWTEIGRRILARMVDPDAE
jgi:hypothetical protein